MTIEDLESVWLSSPALKSAFEECVACIKAVYHEASEILKTPAYTPQEFEIKMDTVPASAYLLRKNFFSTLFQSVYSLLQIQTPRRLLYGKLNHLFRIWVTGADNLLDNEDKVVVPIRLSAASTVMRQVISIMLADRVLNTLLRKAVGEEILYENEAKILSDASLQILLPSAAEEASEEGGITERPEPEYVLETIHKLKTGLLFHVPFLGPDTIEPSIDEQCLQTCKDALMRFGIGSQIVDDIRDMAKDYLQQRQNYVLSIIMHEQPRFLDHLKTIEKNLNPASHIYADFADVVLPAAQKAVDELSTGLKMLSLAGLNLTDETIYQMSAGMFHILSVGELTECIKMPAHPSR